MISKPAATKLLLTSVLLTMTNISVGPLLHELRMALTRIIFFTKILTFSQILVSFQLLEFVKFDIYTELF